MMLDFIRMRARIWDRERGYKRELPKVGTYQEGYTDAIRDILRVISEDQTIIVPPLRADVTLEDYVRALNLATKRILGNQIRTIRVPT